MKTVSKQSGFTLVEEIASLAIISIVLVAFLPVITGSLKNIHVNGNRTINVSSAENIIGNAIKGNSTTGVVQTSKMITMTLKDSEGITILTPGSIKGTVFTFDKSGDNQTTLSTFVPLDEAIRGE
ncbi:type II secretion system GspH family protein [Clostridium estertheticum]|uniref:type II secretion system protein n=1 Tax=Clostridium estertheticum TaxID=238834 RepID=UPI0013EEC3BF|nr:type II secretion system protein [Clostridium estertheticum]MBZ9608714.1 type II secretion system GspH family protein [Clostridium estertheticum]